MHQPVGGESAHRTLSLTSDIEYPRCWQTGEGVAHLATVMVRYEALLYSYRWLNDIASNSHQQVPPESQANKRAQHILRRNYAFDLDAHVQDDY